MHLARGFAIHLHTSGDQDQLWTALDRGRTRHRRVNAELACLVARSGDHAAAGSTAANRYRLASERRVVAGLDRGIKAIRVYVDYLPGVMWG